MRPLWLLLLIVVVMPAVVIGSAWLLQRRLLYFPAGQPPALESSLPAGREITVQTEDGLDLSGWFLAADVGPQAGEYVVLVLPGNAGNRAARVPLAEALVDRGFAVMLMEYRGYGGNPGRPTEEGLRNDARAARRWLVDEHGTDPGKIVYFGESLGAAVAVDLAVEHPPAALILRSPFTSLAEVARAHYPGLPEWLLRDRYASIDRIAAVGAPTLVVVGTRDEVVPPRQSRRLYAQAPDPKRLVTLPAAGHNDPALLASPELLDAVSAFVDEHTRESRPQE